MSKAFISHSSKQKPMIEHIATNLGRNNCTFDSMTFEAGMKTLDEIINGLKSNDLFVLLLSESAVESSWVQNEISAAKALLSKNIKQIFPIIIDPELKHSDKRIPEWLRENYNLKYVSSVKIIENKINNALRILELEHNMYYRNRYELFVGRNELMSSFERSVYLKGNDKPTCIIASGFNGAGRRTFLKNALTKSGFIKDRYEPMSIFIDFKESIENAIIKLSDSNNGVDENILDVINSSMDIKIDYFVSQIDKIVSLNEILLIIDNGSIVQPNRRLANWFSKVLEKCRKFNSLNICVVSRFRPLSAAQLELDNIVNVHIDSLSLFEVEVLMSRYSGLVGEPMKHDDVSFFSKYMNGLPEQIHYTCEIINEEGVHYAKKNIDDIIAKGKNKVRYIVNEFLDDKNAIEILSLMSHIEFISLEFLYDIIGDTSDNRDVLSKMYALGVYDFIGASREYIRVDHAVYDYMKQSKYSLSLNHKNKLREEVKKFLTKSESPNDLDPSHFLFNVREAMLSGEKLPSKYYIPSFVLKTVVDNYNRSRYNEVILLADSALENESKVDENIVRELKYWLCLSLARTRNPRFESEVDFFRGNDLHFLMGFSYRINRNLDNAIREYSKIKTSGSSFKRARRELVDIYLDLGNTRKAQELSKENFELDPVNIYNIQAYFSSLIRSHPISGDDYKIIEKLLALAKNSHSYKASSITLNMNAEYQYYIKNDIAYAVEILRKAISSTDGNKIFAQKSLLKIYQANGNTEESNKIIAEMNK